MSEFEFNEFEQFVDNWNAVYRDFEEFFKTFLLEQAMRVIAKVKPNTPVDTGAMRAMWGIGSQELVVRTATGSGLIEVDPERSGIASIDVVGDNLEVAIWNGMDYASFIEYGARNLDGSWREGIFILTIAVDLINRQMPARFDRAWKQFLMQRGVS